MSRRDQVMVAADGTISVQTVDTFDDPRVSAGGVLSVSTRDAPEVDRLSSDGFTLTTGGPHIVLSANTVSETAPVGTDIGELSVVGGTGVYSFTLLDNAGGLFGTDADIIEVGAGLDYETAAYHDITVQADNGAGSVLTAVLRIFVTDVVDEGYVASAVTFDGTNDWLQI